MIYFWFVRNCIYSFRLNAESTFMLFLVSLVGSTSFYTSTLLPISKSGSYPVAGLLVTRVSELLLPWRGWFGGVAVPI